MPAKDRSIRWRYVAFSITGEARPARNEFLGALMRAARETNLQDSFRITVYEGDFGILKVPHRFKEDAIAALNSVDDIEGVSVKVKTLMTSGTIKTLKERYARFIRAPNERSE